MRRRRLTFAYLRLENALSNSIRSIVVRSASRTSDSLAPSLEGDGIAVDSDRRAGMKNADGRPSGPARASPASTASAAVAAVGTGKPSACAYLRSRCTCGSGSTNRALHTDRAVSSVSATTGFDPGVGDLDVGLAYEDAYGCPSATAWTSALSGASPAATTTTTTTGDPVTRVHNYFRSVRARAASASAASADRSEIAGLTGGGAVVEASYPGDGVVAIAQCAGCIAGRDSIALRPHCSIGAGLSARRIDGVWQMSARPLSSPGASRPTRARGLANDSSISREAGIAVGLGSFTTVTSVTAGKGLHSARAKALVRAVTGATPGSIGPGISWVGSHVWHPALPAAGGVTDDDVHMVYVECTGVVGESQAHHRTAMAAGLSPGWLGVWDIYLDELDGGVLFAAIHLQGARDDRFVVWTSIPVASPQILVSTV